MPAYRVETHAHTSLVSPCGRLTPDELVSRYVDAGYSALVTTDHLTNRLPNLEQGDSWEEKVHLFFSGYRAAYAAAADSGFVVLPGFELTFESLPGRDFLVYGIDESSLIRFPEIGAMEPAVALDRLRRSGALIVQAHPYRYSEPFDASLLDGVEAFNANPRHDSQNELAAAFAREHSLLALSGSDAHQVEDVARGGIVTRTLPASIGEFVDLLRNSDEPVDLIVQGTATARATRRGLQTDAISPAAEYAAGRTSS